MSPISPISRVVKIAGKPEVNEATGILLGGSMPVAVLIPSQ